MIFVVCVPEEGLFCVLCWLKNFFFWSGKSDCKYFHQFGTGTVSSADVRTTDRTETSIMMTLETNLEE